jgi:hypothetical protein
VALHSTSRWIPARACPSAFRVCQNPHHWCRTDTWIPSAQPVSSETSTITLPTYNVSGVIGSASVVLGGYIADVNFGSIPLPAHQNYTLKISQPRLTMRAIRSPTLAHSGSVCLPSLSCHLSHHLNTRSAERLRLPRLELRVPISVPAHRTIRHACCCCIFSAQRDRRARVRGYATKPHKHRFSASAQAGERKSMDNRPRRAGHHSWWRASEPARQHSDGERWRARRGV